MAPKKSVKSETVAPSTVQSEPEVKATKTKRSTKTEEKPVEVVAPTTHTEEVPTGEKKRREISKESIDAAFTTLEQRLTEEIEKMTASGKKFKGVKFLRGFKKAFSSLHTDVNRNNKFKKPNAKKPVTSGFLKPIHISPEMATFLGWDHKQTFSRVAVTKTICKYIKDNGLYNQKDKREIQCDAKLLKLLKYDPANVPIDPKTNKPQALTYFRLQQYLKFHFIKNDEVQATPAAASTKSKK